LKIIIMKKTYKLLTCMALTGIALFGKAQTVCNNFGFEKGMYVDALFENNPEGSVYSEERANFHASILGNPVKENALFYYAAQNKINYLVLYGTSKIFESKSSSINQGYEQLLADFIIRADNKGIKIGLAFGTTMTDKLNDEEPFTGIEPIDEPVHFLRKDIVKKLDNDTTFGAWNKWRSLMENTPNAELTINKQLYALVSVKRIGDLIEEELTTSIKFGEEIGNIPLVLVTEYEWWNISAAEEQVNTFSNDFDRYQYKRDTKFPDFRDLLVAMNAYKNGGMGNVINLERIDVYHNRCPNNPNLLMLIQNAAQKQSWVEDITTYADRILLVNYTQYKSDIGSGNGFDEEVKLFNDHSVKSTLELAPLFNASCDNFISDPAYPNKPKDPGFGDLLADGTTNGASVQQIQQLFKTTFENYPSGTAGNNIHLKGFQWFTYSEMPHMIYAETNNQANKYFASSKKLHEDLKSYYFDNGSLQRKLAVYNPERAPFGAQTSNDNNGLNYQWYFNNTNFTSETALGAINTTEVPANNTGMYYLKTIDALGCVTTSVPVLAHTLDKDVYMRDFNTSNDDGGEPNFNGDLWKSPDIWVNQDSSPDNELRGNPIYRADNYVHVKVRNNGSVASSGTEMLNVYYAKASVSLNWPDAWHNNDDAADENRPIGDRINLVPFYLPSIPAGGEETFVFEWHDLNAEDYWNRINIKETGDFDVGETYGKNRHFCLLARVERSEYAPYGMSVLEVGSINKNTGENNNIAWRNVTILDQNGERTTGGGITDVDDVVNWNTAFLNIGNYENDPVNAKLEFEKLLINNKSLQTDGKMLVNLGTDLFNRWKAGGMQGTGISLAPLNLEVPPGPFSDPNEELVTDPLNELFTTIQINSANAWIENIQINPKEHFEMLVGARVNGNVDEENKYEFVLRHHNKQINGNYELLGGESYELNYSPCPKPEIMSVKIANEVVLMANVESIDLATDYVWFIDDVKIDNENTNILYTNEAGKFHVETTFPLLTCTNQSDPILIEEEEGILKKYNASNSQNVSGIGNKQLVLEIYPNPVRDDLKMNFIGDYEGEIRVTVLDLEGKQIINASYNEIQVKENNSITINTKELPNGNYIVKVISSGNVISKVFTVAN